MSSPESDKPKQEGDCIQLWANMFSCMEEGLSKGDFKLMFKSCYEETIAFHECMEPGQDFSGEIWKTPVDTEQKLDNTIVFKASEEDGVCELMKEEGACKETYIEWEKCVDEAKKNNENVFKKCAEVATDLKKCMLANRDYYKRFLVFSPRKGQDTHEKDVLASKFGIFK